MEINLTNIQKKEKMKYLKEFVDKFYDKMDLSEGTIFKTSIQYSDVFDVKEKDKYDLFQELVSWVFYNQDKNGQMYKFDSTFEYNELDEKLRFYFRLHTGGDDFNETTKIYDTNKITMEGIFVDVMKYIVNVKKEWEV